MKIDKIVFCTSEEFSPFWNIQSYLWKEKIGVEPVCLLWGKASNTNMKDTYGEIIEKEYNPDLMRSFQMTWSKFYHTLSEPDTTWMIGDMDLVPLQKEWFTTAIEDLPDDAYTHLAFGEIPKIAGKPEDLFLREGGYANGNGGMDLAAYYHVAKGSIFNKALGLDECSFGEQINRVIEDGRFVMGPSLGLSREQLSRQFAHIPIPPEERYYWCADENYSSYRIWNSHQEGKITFHNHITPKGKQVDRIDRSHALWDGDVVRSYPQYEPLPPIDVHCCRPYGSQESALRDLVQDCWKSWHE